jgi:archaellum biogenesis protein FlaJ (TadC family)
MTTPSFNASSSASYSDLPKPVIGNQGKSASAYPLIMHFMLRFLQFVACRWMSLKHGPKVILHNVHNATERGNKMKNALILSSLVSALFVSALVALPGARVSQPAPGVTVAATSATNEIPRITIVAKRLTAAEKAVMLQQEQEQTAGKAVAEKQA